MARASGGQRSQRLGNFLALERIQHDDLRLVGQQAERAKRLLLVGARARAWRRSCRLRESLCTRLTMSSSFASDLAVGPGFLDAGLEPLDAVGDDAEVGEEHLLAERRQLGGGVAAGEPVQDDQQGVAFADQGQSLGVVAVRSG